MKMKDIIELVIVLTELSHTDSEEVPEEMMKEAASEDSIQ